VSPVKFLPNPKGCIVKHFKKIIGLSLLGLVAACGGGGGGSASTGATATGLTLTGVAATGAAISSGSVDVKCKTGTGTATTNSDGSYSVTVTSGVGPCILRAIDPVTKVELYSIVEAGGTTANITPVTSLVVANALGDTPATSYSGFNSTIHNKITSTNISSAVTIVQATTASLGTDADMTGVDIMKGSMTPATDSTAGDATDKKIDALMAALTAADKKITDLTEQLKSATTSSDAATKMTSVVGNSKYALANCPYARSGDVWVVNFSGIAPVSFNADFNTMVLKKISDNSTSAINFKRDSNNNAIPCAFTATVGGSLIEYRISEGGIGVWKSTTDFGVTVPVQKSKLLTDPTFVGTYPSLSFLREKTLGYRAALPIRFEVDSTGDMKSYSCDMTKVKPDCLSSIDTASADPTTCLPQSNGTFSCTSTAGLAATGILYATGSQAVMFLAITNMNVGSLKFGGLVVMTKAPTMVLPTIGKTQAADAAWYAGVDVGTNNVVSGGTAASTVESVDASTNSYTTSSAGTTTTYTRYIDTPANGLLFSKNSSAKAVTIGSPTGWSIAMAKGTGNEYDGWYAYVRAKR
jgi:hypothetical protein